jgi:hypothetical protein
MRNKSHWVRAISACAQAALAATAANVAYLAFSPHYDVRFGILQFSAHGIFKPLMYASGSFLIAVLARNAAADAGVPRGARPISFPSLWIVAAALAPYAISFWINYHHTEWAHTDISSSHASFASLARLFYERQYDNFYRPLTLMSLWVDWRLFGDALAWYHVQSLLLHALNALLVARLGRRLGLGDAATTAGLIFAVSPAIFETVIWPGARFDELSVFFSLAAMVLSLRYIADKSRTALTAGCGCLSLGILSKETAYIVPALWLVLLLRRRKKASEDELGRWRSATICFIAVATSAALLRVGVLGGIGGYTENGASLHLRLNLKTFTSQLIRAPLVGQMAIDSSVRLTLWASAAVALFAALLVYVAGTYKPQPRGREWWFVVCLLVSLAPMANLVAFIGPALVQGRYLYFASVWSAMFLGGVIMQTPRPRAALAAWIALAGSATFFNTYVHARRLQTLPGTVTRIAADRVAARQCATIALVDMLDQTNGNLFFSDELLRSVRGALPGVTVEFHGRTSREDASPSACLVYKWFDPDPDFGRLRRIEPARQ